MIPEKHQHRREVRKKGDIVAALTENRRKLRNPRRAYGRVFGPRYDDRPEFAGKKEVRTCITISVGYFDVKHLYVECLFLNNCISCFIYEIRKLSNPYCCRPQRCRFEEFTGYLMRGVKMRYFAEIELELGAE